MAKSSALSGVASSVQGVQAQIIACTRCPRLVRWRRQVASEKAPRFSEETYWGQPVPSFGDARARLLIIGLAPAAHGGNRTGRVFTGDRSGDWLFRALFVAGFANQPTSSHRHDGLQLRDAYITAVIHCAPPANQPLPAEIRNCRRYLLHELELLRRVRVIVALGGLAFREAVKALRSKAPAAGRPIFAHGAEYPMGEDLTLIASFHPSQQNTFTGKLTAPMFEGVFRRARALIDGTPV